MPWQGATATPAATSGRPPERTGSARRFVVEAFTSRAAPPASGTLASRARLVVREGSTPLAPHPLLLAPVRVLGPDAAAAWRAALQQEPRAAAAGAPAFEPVVVSPGITAVVHLRGTGGAELPVVLVHAASAGPLCGLATATPKEARELVVLDSSPPESGAPLALWLPPGPERPDGIVWFLSVEPADAEPALPAAVAEAAAGAAAAAAPGDLLASELRSMVRTLTTVVGERGRRPALHGLARRTGALRCADLSLVADEASLAAIAAELQRSGSPAGDLPADPDAARLAVERAAVTALLPRLDRDELPAPETAWLLRSYGALGWDAPELRLLLAQATTPADAQRAAIAANRDRLMDIDPAVRFEASEWLRRQGVDLGAYDPLQSRDDRREALHAVAAAEAKAAEAAAATGEKR
jgi:hypothetical protein